MEKYKKIYHHTKYDNLFSIITDRGICFRGSYYERFNNDDYGWTKRYVSPVIEKICQTNGMVYVDDSSYKPIIISFGQEDMSDYMWTNYADKYKGIQFVLDYDAICTYADERLDYFNECVYLEANTSEIEHYLTTSMPKLRIEDVTDFQYNLEALSGLIKRKEFDKETEVRYIHPYSIMYSASYDEEKKDAVFREVTPDANDNECYICLPKTTLLGITIGYQSAYKMEKVQKHLQACGFNLNDIDVHVLNNNNSGCI